MCHMHMHCALISLSTVVHYCITPRIVISDNNNVMFENTLNTLKIGFSQFPALRATSEDLPNASPTLYLTLSLCPLEPDGRRWICRNFSRSMCAAGFYDFCIRYLLSKYSRIGGRIYEAIESSSSRMPNQIKFKMHQIEYVLWAQNAINWLMLILLSHACTKWKSHARLTHLQINLNAMLLFSFC